MSFIKTEKISYSYPVLEDIEAFEDDKKSKTSGTCSDEETKEVRLALNNVSIDIDEGKFICILGKNGSGKSTFAKMLNALLVPDEGCVWIDAKDTKAEDLIWEIRKTVGMVFQNPDNQIIGSVVDEEVAFGLENLGVPSPEIKRSVDNALKEVRLVGYDKVSPNKLSGGQKQRLAVAGVLAMEPKCIVLDESTAMLDPKGRKEVMDTVKRLNKEKNITIISITHYMEEAVDADYIFVMGDGEVKMQGSPKEIFTREEEIESLGLTLPQICQLAKALREEGLDIPRGIITSKELKEAIEH